DERGTGAVRDGIERGVDRRQRDAAVLRIDDAVTNVAAAADVVKRDAVRRLRERAAAEHDRRNVELTQRFEDDFRADACGIAERDCERLHARDCKRAYNSSCLKRYLMQCF